LVDTMEYSASAAMGYLTIVLPVSLLLAVLYTLTYHARHNEITAMRATGVSLWRVSVPYFFVGFLSSLALFALNEYWVPRSGDWANRILNRYVAKQEDLGAQNHNTDFATREHRVWHFSEFRVKELELLNPEVSWTLPDGRWQEVRAHHARFTNGIWTFFNATEYSQLTNRDLVPTLVTNVLAMPQLTETPRQIESEAEFSRYLDQHSSRNADIPLSVIFEYLRLHPGLAPGGGFPLFSAHPNPEFKRAYLMLTKLHGRLAAPWTCLVVVFIAIPFGAATGRRNLFVGVAGSISICFSYFVIEQVSVALGYGGYLAPWLAGWLPNIVFGATGLWLMARVR